MKAQARKAASMRRCYWVRDKECDEGKFLVPGCWGGANTGDLSQCTCETRSSIEPVFIEDDDPLLSRITAIEEKLDRILRMYQPRAHNRAHNENAGETQGEPDTKAQQESASDAS